MARVFISYRRKPSAMLANFLARELQGHGIEVYLDTERMDSAGTFPTRLLDAIRNSDVFVCLLAENTLESEWVREEIQAAFKLNKPMVPVFQESYQQIDLAQAPTPFIKALLEYDGVHIFDIKNVYIAQSVEFLASVIKNTASWDPKSPTETLDPGVDQSLLGVNIKALAGQNLGKYQLEALVGMGGMGAVYRATQLNLRRSVAVKILPPDFATQAEYTERFLREAQTAAKLEHVHIVTIHDYGIEGGLNYVVMRLLTGGSLADRLNYSIQHDEPLPSLAETVDVLRKLASALDYAHSQGVIHRDIKTSNVMFDEQGNPFLVDFGIAKLMGSTSALTGTNVTIGTPSYMAPEQWRSEGITPKTDQYALGVMTYVMVTGRMPFEAPTPYALMHKHLTEEPMPPKVWRSDLPDEVKEVLNTAMAKQPADRYPSMGHFAEAFADAVRDAAASKTSFFVRPLPKKEVAVAEPVVTPGGTPVTPGGTPVTPGGTPDTPPDQTPTTMGDQPQLDLDGPTTNLDNSGKPFWQNRVTFLVALGVVLIGLVGVLLVGTQPESFLVAPVSTATETPTPTATSTATPQASATSTAMDTATVTETPSATATQTETPTATSTPSHTPTATASRTPTPSTPVASLLRDQPVRVGPSQFYPVMSFMSAQDTFDIVGISEDGGWYQVVLNDGSLGWVSSSPVLVETAGNVLRVAVALPPTETPTETPLPTDTPTRTPTPTITPSPTATDTPTRTPSPTATATPTPATPVARPLREAVVRLGPGSQYPLIGRVTVDDTLEILGVSDDGAWYQVVLPDNSGIGWVSTTPTLVEVFGNTRILRVAQAPTETPTETPIPTDTPTRTPSPTIMPLPTHTLTPTITPSPTYTRMPTLTLTPTPATPVAHPLRDVALRLGPGSQYPLIGQVTVDDRLEILGISEDGAWYQVALPDDRVGWLSAAPALVEVFGNPRVIQVAQAPTETPTETPLPTYTPTITPSPTYTPTITPSPTYTPTITPSPTYTPTITPLPTYTLTPTVVNCPDALPSRLIVGERGYVNDDDPRSVNVRSGPGLSYGIVGQIPVRTVFDVADGPVCDSGYAWFRINYDNGFTGWIAESGGDVYFVAPLGEGESAGGRFLSADCDVIVQDEFTGGTSPHDWFHSDPEDTYHLVGIVEDYYQLRLNEFLGRDEPITWGSLRGFVFDNARYEAVIHAPRFSEAVQSRTGIWINFQDGNNFLAFMISSTGKYRIARYEFGYTDLVEWTETDAIITGVDVVNTLRVDGRGGIYDFYINGEYITQVFDTTWAEGRFVFFGSTNQVPDAFLLDFVRVCEH